MAETIGCGDVSWTHVRIHQLAEGCSVLTKQVSPDRRRAPGVSPQCYRDPHWIQICDRPGSSEGDKSRPDDLGQHCNERGDKTNDCAEHRLHGLQQILRDLIEKIRKRAHYKDKQQLLPQWQTVERHLEHLHHLAEGPVPDEL